MKLYTILNTQEPNDLGEYLFVSEEHRRDYIEQNYSEDDEDQLELDSEWREPKELLNEYNNLLTMSQSFKMVSECRRENVEELKAQLEEAKRKLEEAERQAKGPELYKISRDGDNRIVESWDEVLNEVNANKGRTLQIAPVEMSEIINFYLENVK